MHEDKISALTDCTRAIRFVWLQIGVTLVVLIILESFARLYLAIVKPSFVDPRASADGYHHASWTREYFSEYHEMRAQWRPYVYWVGAPRKGRYINIDSNGIRATWRGKNSASSRCRHPTRILTFGASAMWGEGARDDYTIASWLQRMLDSTQHCVEVTNMGQEGYVSAQEILVLAEQLRNGDHPDLVIFYDGYNDAHAASITGVAGTTYDEDARRSEFNIGNLFEPVHPRVLCTMTATRLALASGLGTVAKRTVAALAPDAYVEIKGHLERRSEGGTAVDPVRDAHLQQEVVHDYLTNVAVVEGMALRFGFRCLFYWQPTILNKESLTPYERQKEKEEVSGDKEFIAGVYQRMAAMSKNAGIGDLGGVFRDLREPYFIDQVHVTEDGNRIIAEHMLPGILAVLAEMRKVPSGAGPVAEQP